MKPETVNIIGKVYKIEYVDKPSEVDFYKRESLWGQIDFWTRTIRIYDNGRTEADLWETLIHEVLHGIATELNLKSFSKNENHDELDCLGVALTDTLIRNGWLIE